MSIEDIDYLYKNSIKESTVILIDSSNRDKNTFQSPNNYTITLEIPLKFVYGVDILDSSIPRTMYQIDKYNDTLYFYTRSANDEESITLDNKDYTLDDLISALNEKLSVVTNSTELKAIKAYPVSIPSSDVSKIFFSNSNTGTNEDEDFFYILAFKSNMVETLGFDEYSQSGSSDYTEFTSSDNQYSNIATAGNISTYTEDIIKKKTFKSGSGKGDDGKYQISSIYSDKQNLQSPGIVNLVGDRYIKLRSNTIEEHLHVSLSSTSNALGLGLFKLGVSGYVDNRFDFINVKYKDFHPIGKLSSIDFRFETLNNELYDFKGINHHFLLNIKFYTPSQKVNKVDYILNPNYNPNLLDYNKTQYEKYESDEEIDDLTNNFRQNYLEKEKEFIYSSDEDLKYNNNEVLLDNVSDSEESIDTIDSDSSQHYQNNQTVYNSNYKKVF
jgi:hypothetical protein